jgi:hypothetical protein
MFPGEYTIVTSTSDGREVSLFAPAQYVEPEKRLMRVQVLERGGDALLVYLPASPVDFPSRTVKVAAREIISRDHIVK